MWTPDNQPRFVTSDFDFFLPLDAKNLVNAWTACEAMKLDLWLGNEPLDRPRDLWLAERMIERRALTRVSGPNDLLLDLTLVMKGFDFDTVWKDRRDFVIDGVPLATAQLQHIIESKQAAGRLKDQYQEEVRRRIAALVDRLIKEGWLVNDPAYQLSTS